MTNHVKVGFTVVNSPPKRRYLSFLTTSPTSPKDFAIPPNEDQLHKPAPKRVWQKGEGKWHVDAPVNVVGDKVLVPTSFLDKEKVGERALFCLDAKTGDTVWKADLKFNPWGGAAVLGD